MAIRPVDSRTLLNAWREPGAGQRCSPARRRSRWRAGWARASWSKAGWRRQRLARRRSRAACRPRGDARPRLTRRRADRQPDPADRSACGAQLLRPRRRRAGGATAGAGRHFAAALRAYLDGWALLRRQQSRRRPCEASRTALARRLTFALAALGAARADLREQRAASGTTPEAQLAWRLRDRLTPSDRAYLEAYPRPRVSRDEPAERVAGGGEAMPCNSTPRTRTPGIFGISDLPLGLTAKVDCLDAAPPTAGCGAGFDHALTLVQRH